MGAEVDMAALSEEIRDRTAPARRKFRQASLARDFAAALLARGHVANEIGRAAGSKDVDAPKQEQFKEPPADIKGKPGAGIAFGKDFLPDILKKRLMGRSLTWAGVATEDLLRDITTTVMEAITSGAGDEKSVMARLDGVFRGWVRDGSVDPTTGEKLLNAHKLEAIARTQTMAAYNAGRMDLLMDDDLAQVVPALVYSAILDGRTSPFCQKWDGTVVKKTPENEALIQELNPPNHAHCRSLWAPVTEYEEWTETPADQRPTDVQPQRGFGVVPTAQEAN